jgi:hypothetical protein
MESLEQEGVGRLAVPVGNESQDIPYRPNDFKPVCLSNLSF